MDRADIIAAIAPDRFADLDLTVPCYDFATLLETTSVVLPAIGPRPGPEWLPPDLRYLMLVDIPISDGTIQYLIDIGRAPSDEVHYAEWRDPDYDYVPVTELIASLVRMGAAILRRPDIVLTQTDTPYCRKVNKARAQSGLKPILPIRRVSLSA